MKKEDKRGLFILISIIVFTVIWIVFGYLLNKSKEKQIYKHKKKELISFLDTTAKSISEIKFFYSSLEYLSKKNPELYLPLMEDAKKILVYGTRGKKYVNEFTEMPVREEIDTAIITYGEYLKNIQSYQVKTIYIPPKKWLEKKALKFHKKYGWDKTTCYLIARGQIKLGMTDEMVRVAWGNPKDINRSVGSWGTHEQWVYPNYQYLYFKNGILTSWQD